MDNKKLETKVKEILANKNMFDMIIAAKQFDKEYRTSDFYKATKMSLAEVIKNAQLFYTLAGDSILATLQNIINQLDLTKFNELMDQIGTTFGQENADTMAMLDELKDFKDIVKKN